MPKIAFNLKFFSSYYITILLTYFLLQVQFINDTVSYVSQWIVTLFTLNGYQNALTNGKVWLVLFFSVVIFTFIIQQLIILPLEFFIGRDVKLDGWTKFFMFLFVFGSQIFLINKIFSQPMPQDFLPIPESWNVFLIRLLGGYDNTFNVFSETGMERTLWQVRDIIWYIGPISFMYFKTLLVKDSPSKEG